MPSSGRVSATANVYELFTGASTSAATTWEYALPVTRQEAESVPAVARSIDLVASTIAGLPLKRYTDTGAEAPLGWLEQPEPNRPRFSTINALVRDLILDGDAWLVPDSGKWWHVPPSNVSVQVSYRPDAPWVIAEHVMVNGVAAPEGTLHFRGWHDGIRRHGARLLRTALALDGAAKRMADSPKPQTTLKNTSNYELTDDEIDAMLAAYKAARQASSTAYLNSGVDEIHNGWNSVEQQLVEARQFTNGQCANLCGVPGHMIAGGTGSSNSLTYANITQENRAFLDYGLNPALKAIEATLSAADPGHFTRFNLAGVLRGNPAEVATIITQLQPIGVITTEEAREWVDLAPGAAV